MHEVAGFFMWRQIERRLIQTKRLVSKFDWLSILTNKCRIDFVCSCFFQPNRRKVGKYLAIMVYLPELGVRGIANAVGLGEKPVQVVETAILTVHHNNVLDVLQRTLCRINRESSRTQNTD